MPSLILPSRFGAQPQQGGSLIAELANYARVLVNPGVGRFNLINGEAGTINDAANIAQRTGAYGKSISITAAGGSTAISFPIKDGLSGSNGYGGLGSGYTLLLDFVCVNAITSGGLFQISGTASSTIPNILLNADTGNDLRFYTSGGYRITVPGVLTAGSRHRLGITFDNRSTITMVRNGQVVGIYGSAPGAQSPGVSLWLGNGYPSSAVCDWYFALATNAYTDPQLLRDITAKSMGAAFQPAPRMFSSAGGSAAAAAARPRIFVCT